MCTQLHGGMHATSLAACLALAVFENEQGQAPSRVTVSQGLEGLCAQLDLLCVSMCTFLHSNMHFSLLNLSMKVVCWQFMVRISYSPRCRCVRVDQHTLPVMNASIQEPESGGSSTMCHYQHPLHTISC